MAPAPPPGGPVRTDFTAELEELERRTMEGLDMVDTALDRTMEALEHTDVELAELVIADDDRLDDRYMELHRSLLALLATQAPVAGDLRLVAALLHVMKCMERMGDQCVNVAKLIPLAGHESPRDQSMLTNLLKMGGAVKNLTVQAKRAFIERDEALAKDLVRGDEVVDELNRDCFRLAVRIGDDEDTREWAMSMMLAARALERTGDNAVDIGEQAAFVVSGMFTEFEDASHPEISPGEPPKA